MTLIALKRMLNTQCYIMIVKPEKFFLCRNQQPPLLLRPRLSLHLHQKFLRCLIPKHPLNQQPLAVPPDADLRHRRHRKRLLIWFRLLHLQMIHQPRAKQEPSLPSQMKLQSMGRQLLHSMPFKKCMKGIWLKCVRSMPLTNVSAPKLAEAGRLP